MTHKSFKHNSPYLILDENAQYHECGFSCDNAIVVCVEDVKFFITDSRYTIEAMEYAHINTQVIESMDFVQSVQGIVSKQGIKELVFNPQEMCLELYQRLNEGLDSLKCKLVGVPNFHQQLRIIKTPDEIALIRKSQELNKKAFKQFAHYLEKALKKAPSEKALHYQAKQFLSYFGKYDLSFDPIVGLNANASKPHALPSNRCFLTKNDLLLFDAGIKYKRYCSDMTRSASIRGEIHFGKKQKFKNKKQQEIYDIVRKAQERAISGARSGMKSKEIDKLARDVIEKSGYGKYFVHSTGHGVGVDIHELPRISRMSEEYVRDGMVFSIEPGIYLPGEFGVRIEDLVVMKDGRAQIL